MRTQRSQCQAMVYTADRSVLGLCLEKLDFLQLREVFGLIAFGVPWAAWPQFRGII